MEPLRLAAIAAWMNLILVPNGIAAEAAGSTSPVAVHPGLEIFTHQRQSSIAKDAIGLRFSGPITRPLAEHLADLLLGTHQRYHRVVLELDSTGGELGYVREVIVVLAQVRYRTEFTTRVLGGGTCASGCIALFMQGTKRKASGASVWIFHGACSLGSNVPSIDATQDYLDVLQVSGVDADFLCSLKDRGYVTQAGNLFLSGYELFYDTTSGIITELLPAWQPEKPVFPPIMPPR